MIFDVWLHGVKGHFVPRQPERLDILLLKQMCNVLVAGKEQNLLTILRNIQ